MPQQMFDGLEPDQVAYQIANWAENHETNKSKEIDHPSKMIMPNASNMALARILSHENGAAFFGIFALLVSYASQHSKAVRDGWITEDGHKPGAGWADKGRVVTAGDMALMFRRPYSEVKSALAFLSSPEVSWIKEVMIEAPAKRPRSANVVPAPVPQCAPLTVQNSTEQDCTEQDCTEQHEEAATPPASPAVASEADGDPSDAKKPGAPDYLWGKRPIQLDTRERRWVGLHVADNIAWAKAYPACDVNAELLKMAEWCIANPTKGRKYNYKAFIVSWLTRTQDKGGTHAGNGRSTPSGPGAQNGAAQRRADDRARLCQGGVDEIPTDLR